MAVRDALNERVEKTVDIPHGKGIIRIKHTFYCGKPFVDIRFYYSEDGTWKPTKKGVMVPAELAEDASAAIMAVLPRYSERDEKGVMKKYIVTQFELSKDGKFTAYSDMLFSSASDAKKFSPSDSDGDWRIYKITYDSTCYSTKYERLSFKKLLSVDLRATYQDGWKTNRP